MTYRQFLRALRKTPRKWFLEEGRLIRFETKSACDCPIVVVCAMLLKKRYENFHYSTAANKLGLSKEVRFNLVQASDSYGGMSRIRRDLLKATGLI